MVPGWFQSGPKWFQGGSRVEGGSWGVPELQGFPGDSRVVPGWFQAGSCPGKTFHMIHSLWLGEQMRISHPVFCLSSLNEVSIGLRGHTAWSPWQPFEMTPGAQGFPVPTWKHLLPDFLHVSRKVKLAVPCIGAGALGMGLREMDGLERR